MDDNIDNEICPICALPMKDKYVHCTKECNHKFHYECLIKTFQHTTNNCPYCRNSDIKLPLVNGLKKTYLKTPFYFEYNSLNDIQNYKSIPCKHVITRGKNKGNLCNKSSKIGYDYCSNHC